MCALSARTAISKSFLSPIAMTPSRPFLITLPVILCLVNANAFADDTAQQWLMRMNQAASNQNYDGVFVYQHGEQLQSMRIIHRSNGVASSERLVALSGIGREVIRNDREVRCYLPDENAVLVEHRKADNKGFPNIVPSTLSDLDANYDIRLGKVTRVANRKAQQVIIRPKDTYRYGYYLWADKETGLLLKAYLIDHHGTIIEQFMFTEIKIAIPIPDSDLEPQNKAKDYIWYREQAPTAMPAKNSSNWTVSKLPKGFNLSAHMQRTLANHSQPVEQMIYSDGLAVVSVFVEFVDKDTNKVIDRKNRLRGVTTKGAVHAFGRNIDNYHITVVGEVPAMTIVQFGRSLTPSPANAGR